MKRTKGLSFDSIFLKICRKVPLLGSKVEAWYISVGWFRRFVKFSVTTFVIYWSIRAPMIIFFTEYLRLWYPISVFIVGIIMSLIGFAVSEGWIWKK